MWFVAHVMLSPMRRSREGAGGRGSLSINGETRDPAPNHSAPLGVPRCGEGASPLYVSGPSNQRGRREPLTVAMYVFVW